MPKNYLYSLRRLALAGVIGLIGAALLLWVVGAQLTQPGGAALWLLTGGLIGVAYSALFTHNQADHTADLLRGLVVGLVTWSAWTLNLLPTLLGNGPMWQAEAVAHTVPQLIGCLLVGGWSGLIYSLLFARLAALLGLEAPVLPPTALKTRMVVLGGGYAGVATAQSLEEEFANDPSVGIWLVSETNFLLHTPMLSEVAGSAVDAQNISPPLRAFFHKVQVVQGAVAQIDLTTHTIRLAGDKRSGERVLPFDHLALTMGGIPNFFGNQSLEQRSFTLKSLEDAIRLRNQIIDMFERADSEPNQAKRQRMLTFVVAGGGFAGVELIGSLNDFARGILAYYRNVEPAEVRLVLVHSGETILPELKPELGQYAQEKLSERGVEFMLKTRCTGATEEGVELGDLMLPTETFIWTAGNRPAPVLETLGLPLNKRGQLPVDATLAVKGTPSLWAAGDCAEIPDPHSKTGFAPPTAQHALREGKLLGHNMAAALRGKTGQPFSFKTLGSLSALGHQLAVAEVFGYRFSGFLAWVMWRSIYISKLPNMEKRVRVGLNWLIDLFFPPDIVQTQRER